MYVKHLSTWTDTWKYCRFVSGFVSLWDDYNIAEPIETSESTGPFLQMRDSNSSRSDNNRYYRNNRRFPRTSRFRAVEQPPGSYNCTKCSKSYRWKQDLVEHSKTSCGSNKEECCPFCSYRTNRRWNLKSHMRRIHTAAWNYRRCCRTDNKKVWTSS